MDPIIGGAIIKGVGGLLGGLFGKKKAPTPGQNIMSHMQGIRDGAEKYGFNPLAWAGTGAVTAPEPTNYMGSAIADAIGGVADAWSNKAFNNAQLDQLEMENEKMRRELNAATIRPDVPGLYARTSFAGSGGSPFLGVPPQERQEATENRYPGRGETIETGAGGYATVVEGSLADRPTEIGPVQNQPWFKELNVGGRDVLVWNDEAADSEIAALGMLMTVPWQYAGQVVKDRWNRGLRHPDGTTQEIFPKVFRDDEFLGNHLVPKDWWKQ